MHDLKSKRCVYNHHQPQVEIIEAKRAEPVTHPQLYTLHNIPHSIGHTAYFIHIPPGDVCMPDHTQPLANDPLHTCTCTTPLPPIGKNWMYATIWYLYQDLKILLELITSSMVYYNISHYIPYWLAPCYEQIYAPHNTFRSGLFEMSSKPQTPHQPWIQGHGSLLKLYITNTNSRPSLYKDCTPSAQT